MDNPLPSSPDPVSTGLKLGDDIILLVKDVLDRHDRDKLDNEFNEEIDKIQHAFSKPDDQGGLDDQWALAYRLLNDIGHPLTPPRSMGASDAEFTDREFRHHCLVSLAELKRDRSIISRLMQMLKK